MNKSTLLKVEPELLLRLPESGLVGYSPPGYSSCFLLLSDHKTIKVSTKETCVASKFDCFSLALDLEIMPEGAVTKFETTKGSGVSVLIREDYIETYTGDTSKLVGNNPVTHSSAKVGEAPENALAKSIVAYGLLFEGHSGRLVVAADWFPTKIEVTTDESKIETILSEGDALSVATYIQHYAS